MSPKPRTRIAFFDEETEQTETMWVARVDEDLYRLENIPFFFYGVSLGDVVQARWRPEDLDELEPHEQPGDYGFPYFERVARKGGNRTLRLAMEGDAARVEILTEISRMGCSYEHFPPLLVAINVPQAVSLDAVMACLVSRGCQWENGDPETEAVPGRVAYLMEINEAAVAGPDDDGLDGDTIIPDRSVCGTCGRPVTVALLLRAHPRRLRFVRHAAVALCTCDRGCSVVTARLITAAPQGAKAARVLRYRRCEEHNPWADGSRTHHGGELVDKVGGYPQWNGRERTPRCAVCDEPMALVAQLTGRLAPALGAGFLFVCPDEHTAEFVR